MKLHYNTQRILWREQNLPQNIVKTLFEIVLLKRNDAVKEASFHLERKNEGVSQSPQEENSPESGPVFCPIPK